MAHVFVGSAARIVHNGDYSGDVTIENYQTLSGVTVTVPFEDLAQFVTGYYADILIREIEQVSAEDIRNYIRSIRS